MEHLSIDFSKIDHSWTLFLDRDGVINVEKRGTYVLKKNDFVFYEGVKEALKKMSNVFGNILVATNQRGVSRGYLTLDDLKDIHDFMHEEISEAGGRIDKIYFCTDAENESQNRKPNPGMALQAKHDFPQIDFSKSIMVGNSESDVLFARNAGMHAVFIASTEPGISSVEEFIEARFNSLLEFANAITS